jgi:tetratricopeptide (TPR) repeat protein
MEPLEPPRPAPPRPPADGRRWDLAALAACLLLAFLAFAPTLGHGFLVNWDDGPYVLQNEHLRSLGPATVLWAFTSFHSYFWAPLTWLSFAVDHALWGLDPFGYHLGNVLFHALDAGLVFLVARRLLALGAPGWRASTTRSAALLAALGWALHPLRVESVAWVAERKDVLSGALGLLSVLLYLRHAAGPARRPWRSPPFLGAFTLFALSACAKPSLTTLPAVLLLLDGWPLGRLRGQGWRAALLEKAPWLLVSAGATLLTLRAHAEVAMPLEFSDVPSRVLIALGATWRYLALSLWPAGLSPFYLHPGQVSPLDPAYLLPALAVLALTGAALWQARRRPAITAAWFAYLALVAPGLSSTQVSLTAMADRFTYLPAIPLTLLAAAGAAGLLERWPSRRARAAGWTACAAAVLGLTAVTLRLEPVWKDDVSLWTRAIEVRPHFSGRTYFMRAIALEQRGDLGAAARDLDEALAIAAAKRLPQIGDLYLRRARLRGRLGDLAGAAQDYDQAAAAEPAQAGALQGEREDLRRALERRAPPSR